MNIKIVYRASSNVREQTFTDYDKALITYESLTDSPKELRLDALDIDRYERIIARTTLLRHGFKPDTTPKIVFHVFAGSNINDFFKENEFALALERYKFLGDSCFCNDRRLYVEVQDADDNMIHEDCVMADEDLTDLP